MSKILLDTHTFLWLADTPERLPERVRTLVAKPDTERIVSIASLWEIAIKKSLGKLSTRHTVPEFMQTYQDVMVFLPIQAPHLAIIESLPLHHRDPFDRLIIAQAMAENIPVVSIDTAFDAYRVERVW
jgi:PIN domain nuclease of toxin-antitoxin system